MWRTDEYILLVRDQRSQTHCERDIAIRMAYKMEDEIHRSRTYVIYHERVLCVCITIRRNIGIFEKKFLEKKFASEFAYKGCSILNIFKKSTMPDHEIQYIKNITIHCRLITKND